MTSASLQMTVEEVRNLPPVVDVLTAAAILGIWRTAAYELAMAHPDPASGQAHTSAQRSSPRSRWRFPVKHDAVAQRHTHNGHPSRGPRVLATHRAWAAGPARPDRW